MIGTHANMLVPHYLIACYCYYVLDAPLITDKLFDEIALRLQAEWDSIEHMHKHHITLDDLKAGTGYAIQYPAMVIGAANNMASKWRPTK